MAKSDWTSGTYLSPDFCQGFFGTSGATGHIHDGADDEGSAPQVILTNAAHVQGDLPLTNIKNYETGTFYIKVTPPTFDVRADFTCTYEKLGSRCTLFFPLIAGSSTADDRFDLEPRDGTWTSAIVPSTAQTIPVVALRETDGEDVFKPGFVNIPTSDTTNWPCYILFNGGDGSNYFSITGFGYDAATSKGLYAQTITYFTD